jgi:hypothetical protein
VQWPYRGWQEPQAWREETDAYADAALVYAARALRDAGGHIDRLPHRSHILAFCRAALDLCAEPLVDDGPVRPALLDKVPPPPAVPGDRIGSLLERYDPVVRHAQELAEPLERNTAVFIYDASCQEYVLQDEHGDEDENEVPDLTLDKSEGSPARARAGAHVPCSKGGDGSQPPRQMTPPTPPAVGTPTDVELASEGRPSLNDAPRAPSAARK